MNKLIQLLIRWMPALILMAGIYWLSSTPSRELPDFGGWDLFVKKMGHLTGYAALGLATLRGVNPARPRATLVALAVVILFAITDEVHQSFVPGRTAAWYDVLIDASGASASLYFSTRLPLLQRLVQAV